MKKIYVLFAISDKPIDLRIASRDGMQHFVHEEMELAHNDGVDGRWIINKNVSHHGHKDANLSVSASGDTVSIAVVNWLKNLVGDVFGYVPFRDKKQEYLQDGDIMM